MSTITPIDNGLEFFRSSDETRKKIIGELKLHHSGSNTESDIKNADKLKEDFADLRDQVLIANGMGEFLDEIKDFSINLEHREASFTSLTGEKVTVDLWNMQDENGKPVDENIQKLADSFFEEASKLIPLNPNIRTTKYSTGNQKGEKPMVRGSSEVFKKLPSDLDAFAKDYLSQALPGIDPKHRSEVMNRVLYAVATIKKLKESFDKEIEKRKKEKEKLEQDLKDKKADSGNADKFRMLNQLKGEIEQLTLLKMKLEYIDVYALIVMLTRFPVGTLDAKEVNAAAEKMGKEVLEKLGVSKEAFGRLNGSLPLHGKDNKEEAELIALKYIRDIILSFYKVQGRRLYADKCKELGILPKQEGLEELLFRQALAYGKDQKDTSNLLLPALLEDEKIEKVKESVENIVGSINFDLMIPNTIRTFNETDPKKFTSEVDGKLKQIDINAKDKVTLDLESDDEYFSDEDDLNNNPPPNPNKMEESDYEDPEEWDPHI